MSVRKLIHFPDRTLTHPCSTVRQFGESLRETIQELWDTLYASPGVGLAANQIGLSSRVAVIDVSKRNKGKKPFVLINPVLLKGQGLQIPKEGCLSVPDFLANVRRYESVLIRYQDEKGQEQRMSSEGFEALAIQHEIDHLDGKLFLDRVTNLKTDIFLRKKI